MKPKADSKSPYNPDHSNFQPEHYSDSEINGAGMLAPDKEPDLDEISTDNLLIQGPDYYTNYELSWLDFNFRVLFEAQDDRNPILERVNFIGIVCSNLDEFFQKRVGGLKRQIEAGMDTPSVDGLTPMEQLKAIRRKVKKMINDYRSCFFDQLKPELKKSGIEIRPYKKLTAKQKKAADDYFEKQLYPILTPLVVDQAHPFPFISNKSRSFAVEIKQNDSDDFIFARIKVPNNRPRWLVTEQSEEHAVMVNIDDIIKEHIHRLFSGAEVVSANIFRVTRNADIKRNEEEADDLLELIEEELRERRFAEVVRLEIDAGTPRHIREMLLTKMGISPLDVFDMEGPIGLADCMQLTKIKGFQKLRYKTWVPTLHPAFRHAMDEDAPDIFSIIRSGDFMVHHPYHSFATSVQRFVEDAASDPKVVALKQTLYRTSPDSRIMHSLIKAAEAGKQVAVLVELKARFDEQQNIDWAMKLEKAGIHVSYGLPGLKIHSKVTVVVRDEAEGIRRYVHVGTGNYHPGTANLYEDFGLFTCNEDIASDVTDLFNFLTGFAPNQTYKKLLVAPKYLRSAFNDLIKFEMNEAKAGRPARIIAKMNSLEDPILIQKLYQASRQGVSIDLIVRGVCRLKPGVSWLSENIRIHSVIGRFLEHSRVYYFQHGGKDLFYIGSADMMHRNLDARVETITPIENEQLKAYLQFVLKVLLKDNRQRWVLKKNGSYKKIYPEKGEVEVGTHSVLMNHSTSYKDPIPSSTTGNPGP